MNEQRYATLVAALLLSSLLSSCGERASTWDDHAGRYQDTDQVRRDQINREFDRRELEKERER